MCRRTLAETPLLHAIPDRYSHHGRFTVDFPMRIPLLVTKWFSRHKGYFKYLLKLLYSRCLPCEDLKEVRGEGAPAKNKRAPGSADGGADSSARRLKREGGRREESGDEAEDNETERQAPD